MKNIPNCSVGQTDALASIYKCLSSDLEGDSNTLMTKIHVEVPWTSYWSSASVAFPQNDDDSWRRDDRRASNLPAPAGIAVAFAFATYAVACAAYDVAKRGGKWTRLPCDTSPSTSIRHCTVSCSGWQTWQKRWRRQFWTVIWKQRQGKKVENNTCHQSSNRLESIEKNIQLQIFWIKAFFN